MIAEGVLRTLAGVVVATAAMLAIAYCSGCTPAEAPMVIADVAASAELAACILSKQHEPVAQIAIDCGAEEAGVARVLAAERAARAKESTPCRASPSSTSPP